MNPSEMKKYLRRMYAIYPKIAKQHISGYTPSFVVGEKGYPKVGVVFSSSTRPERLSEMFGKPMATLVRSRMETVAAIKRVHIKREIAEELSLSVTAPETEVSLKSRPKPRLMESPAAPFFLSSKLKSIRVVSFKIPEKLEKIVEDEMRAADAVWEIYRKFGIYKAADALSAGLLGSSKRMVPTRWAITAADDMVGKHLIKDVLTFRSINSPEFYYAEYLDNRFVIALLPGPWSFELIEKWPGMGIISDMEGSAGRKDYPSSTEGAYHAARLAVLEHLSRRRRQASAVVMRVVGKGYSVPMGVWVIRETARRAFENRIPAIPPSFLGLWRYSRLKSISQSRISDFWS